MIPQLLPPMLMGDDDAILGVVLFGPVDDGFAWTSTDEPLQFMSTDEPLGWVT